MTTTMLGGVGLVLGLLSAFQHCAADFTGVSFDQITAGGSLNLTWDSAGLGADSFPLVVAVSLINQTADSGVFGYKTNLSSSVDASSYLWQGLPYPAPYLPTAQYQIEVKPSRTNGLNSQAVVATSPFFFIHQAAQPPASSPGDTSQEPGPGSPKPGGTGRSTSVAIGVVVGVFSLMGFGVVVWYFRRRQRRATEERRRRKRLEFVIS